MIVYLINHYQRLLRLEAGIARRLNIEPAGNARL